MEPLFKLIQDDSIVSYLKEAIEYSENVEDFIQIASPFLIDIEEIGSSEEAQRFASNLFQTLRTEPKVSTHEDKLETKIFILSDNISTKTPASAHQEKEVPISNTFTKKCKKEKKQKKLKRYPVALFEESVNQYYFSFIQEMPHLFDKPSFVFSPYSFSHTLQLVAMLAPQDIREETFLYLKYIGKHPSTQLNDEIFTSADSLWYNSTINFPERFIDIIEEYGSIHPFTIPGSMDEINGYIKEKTHGSIPAILHDELDPDTSLLAINASYFEGEWEKPFESMNKTVVFHGKTRDSTPPMMRINSTSGIQASSDEKSVFIPFKNGYAMFVCMTDFPLFNSRSFCVAVDSLHSGKVRLEMPKFSVNSFYKFDNELNNLRIKNEICLPGNSYLNEVLQCAKIDVNEKGAVAAAGTVCIAFPKAKQKIYNVVVDKPFHFFIIHEDSKMILFAGQVNDL
ncbi:serpin family protein [Histomonas meleagridis]|uniref:serpin family protein n=1 Tax=Histomonas meleagridis TaxID=135588 RepID=UPI0035596442|nr:serpin family protein [Histomonas meleagridis]KAH0800815.1 serpin family protein [Histomonas meleagridis]